MASSREQRPRVTSIDGRPQGRSGYMPGDYSLTKRGALTPLNEWRAENTVNPSTGMKYKPSSFDIYNRSNQMAKAGEFEAKALFDQRYQGTPEQQAGAQQGIDEFRATRAALAMRAAPQQSSSFPQQGMTNPYFKGPAEAQIGGMLSDAATKAFAPPPVQQRTPAFDTGSMYGAPVAGEKRQISSQYGGGSSTFTAKPSATAFTPDPQTLADMRSRRSAIRDVESPILGPSAPPPQTIQSSTIGLRNPYPIQSQTPQAATVVQPVLNEADIAAQIRSKGDIALNLQEAQAASQSGLSRLAGGAMNLGRRAVGAAAPLAGDVARLGKGLYGGVYGWGVKGGPLGSAYRSQPVQNFLYGDAAKKAEVEQYKKLLSSK